jgi:serine/threonine protein kinase
VPSSSPRLLGPYCLLRLLAEGGMGAVYISTALDEPGERLCLVKTLKPGVGQGSVNDEYLRRFMDEARVAVCLQGEHLCHVFDAGEADGELFLAMELIEGVTFRRLGERLAEGQATLPSTQALTLGIGMLKGLYAAHLACDESGRPLGVVHRDVSPQNVMVDRFGQVKVIDFGLATSTLKETVTEQAVVMGKMAYMAPEQARGEPVTAAADQYAAAVVLYELLTGDRFYGDLPARGIWGIVGAGTHQPRAWSRVPAEIAPILRRALAPTVGARFPDCQAFAAALQAVSMSTPTAPQASLAAWIAPFLQRELDPIDEARARLRELPATVRSSVPEATERVRARLQGSTSSPASPRRQAIASNEDTEAARTAPGLLSPSLPSLSPLPSPSLSLVAPTSKPPRARHFAGLIVAGALVVGAGSIVVAGLRRPPPSPARPPEAVVAPTTPVQAVAPAAVAITPPAPVVAAPPPVVPPPVVPPPPSPTPTRPGKTQAIPSALTPLRVRATRLGQTCERPCVQPVIGIINAMTRPDEKTVAAAERRLEMCEARCRE